MCLIKCRCDSVQTSAQDGSNIPTLNLQSKFDGFPSNYGWRPHRRSEKVPKPYLGPKHMQRLARYPLEKEKRIMKPMYQASWVNATGRFSRGWTLHSMKSGMKTTLTPHRTGSQMLSLPGWTHRGTTWNGSELQMYWVLSSYWVINRVRATIYIWA